MKGNTGSMRKDDGYSFTINAGYAVRSKTLVLLFFACAQQRSLVLPLRRKLGFSN